MPLQDDTFLGTGGVATPFGLNNGYETTGIGPLGRVYVYDIQPLTLNVNNVAVSQTPSPTTSSPLTVGPGTGTSSVVINGITYVKLDVPRNLSFTSGGTDTSITFNVVGLDFYQNPMTENVTGANQTIARGNKAWMYVQSITPSSGVASTIQVGTDDTFGLPIFLRDKTYCAGVRWNNTLAQDTGTLLQGATGTATHTTTDVRGTYKPSSGASNGASRLVFLQSIAANQVGSGATSANIIGVTQA